VDFGVGLQELVKLGVRVRPGESRRGAPGGMISLLKSIPAWQPVVVVGPGGMSVPLSLRMALAICVAASLVVMVGIWVPLSQVGPCNIWVGFSLVHVSRVWVKPSDTS